MPPDGGAIRAQGKLRSGDFLMVRQAHHEGLSKGQGSGHRFGKACIGSLSIA